MRVSVLEHDPGFVRDPWTYTVTLDGAVVDRCLTADDETGIVLCRTACIAGDRAPREFSMRGAVSITRRPGSPWPSKAYSPEPEGGPTP